MATDLTALKETFLATVRCFNSGNFDNTTWVQFQRVLDDRVAMKKLDDADYHVGIDAVKKYFFGHGNYDKATFTAQTSDFQMVADFGFVSGFASFVDRTTSRPPSKPRLVAYSFTFVRDGGDWRAMYLWGKYLQSMS